MLSPMDSSLGFPAVRVGVGPDGSRSYGLEMAPEALPAVRGRDLERAWDAAREAALGGAWGAGRGFCFRRADGGTTELALADADALCWAGAVDATVGLGSCYGLSVCLRLLALVDLLARATWTAGFWRLARDGAELDPLLLRAAAVTPLSEDARFDEALLRARIAPLGLPSPPAVVHSAGTPAA